MALAFLFLGYGDPAVGAGLAAEPTGSREGGSSSDPRAGATLPGQLCTLANGRWVWEHKQVSPPMPGCLRASHQVCFSRTVSLMASFHLENRGNGTVHTEQRDFFGVT